MPNNRSPAYQFLEILIKKWFDFDFKNVINNKVMVLYLDSVVRITSHVQTLILDLASTPNGG